MENILSNIDWAALSAIIPTEVFMWIKIALIVIVVYFSLLIIKSIIQIGTAWRIRNISKKVNIIDNKIDTLINQSNNNYYQEEQYMQQ